MQKTWKKVAERQLGLITTEQLKTAGVSHSQRHTLYASGQLVQVHRYVHRVDGAPVTLDQRRLAAVLASDTGVLSHRAAAAVWGATAFRSAGPELSVSSGRSARLPGVVVHRVRSLLPADVMAHQHYPRITRPARTVVDLAALDSEVDDAHLEEAGADLLLAFPQEQRRLRRLKPTARGFGRLDRLFGEFVVSGRRPPHPGLERLLLGVVRSSSLPDPVVHHRVVTPDGTLEVDLAWPDARLAVEADSARWHSSPAHLRTDHRRDQALTMVGWASVRFPWEQVRDDPEEVVRRISAVRDYRLRQCDV